MKRVLHAAKWVVVGLNAAVVLWLLASGWGVYVSPAKASVMMPLCLSFPVPLVLTLLFLLFWLIVRWKFALISIAGIAAVLPSVRDYCPINFPNPHPKGALSVMSYNVRGFQAPAEDDESTYITDYVVKKNPDVLCIQEHTFARYSEHGKAVVKALEHWKYKREMYIAPENSLAIYSKYPIVKVDTIQKNFHLHGAAAFYLEVGSDTIVVVNCHLVSNGIGPEDVENVKELQQAIRAKNKTDLKSKAWEFLKIVRKTMRMAGPRALQADTIADYIESVAGGRAVVFCGDLNDSPNSYVHKRLCRALDDAYVASGNGPGISFNTVPFFFRLDNILCSRDWKAYDAEVDRTIHHSDHYPMECFLKRKKS